MDSLFSPVGPERFEPTSLTGGPWRPDAQHGGPPSALLAHMIESQLEPTERVARLSVELVKPVPLATLDASAQRTSVSRRVAHADAELRTGSVVVATARALLLSTATMPEPQWRPNENSLRPGNGELVRPPTWASGDNVAFHRDAVEHRIVRGGFSEAGAAVEWIRLRVPVVAGASPSPLQRVAAAADVASGISAIYSVESGVGLINADLSIALHRDLTGEWCGLDAATHIGPDGVGLCITRLFDEQGTIGTSTQSLLGLTTQPTDPVL